jgi:hypothetical protein
VKTKLLSKASEYFGEGEWLLQADGDPAHTAKHTVEELEHLGESRDFSLLSWPPHSPDMNPVENVFSQLKNLVSEAPLSQNTKGLQALIESNIELLNAEENHFYFQHLYDSMHDRCFQVIKAHGFPTTHWIGFSVCLLMAAMLFSMARSPFLHFAPILASLCPLLSLPVPEPPHKPTVFLN